MNKTLIIASAALLTAWASVDAQSRLSARSATARAHMSTNMVDRIRPTADEQSRPTAAYITIDPDAIDLDALEAAGAKVSMQLDTLLTVRLPLPAIDDIAAVPGVKYVQVASSAAPMLDVARPEVGIDKVHSGTPATAPYTGKGVIVGIVDSGFDYKHAAFRAPDGTLRILRVWEQGTEPTETLLSPEKYGYGVELTTPDDIIAAEGDIFGNSHGTHVASIAAGSDTYLDGLLRGMAPEAGIVLVSMTDSGSSNVSISDGIAYIFDYAESLGLPCVVNISLGAHSGPHDGTSTFDVIADRLQGPGRIIVGSAGNHRADSFHVNADVADSAPIRTFIDYKRAPSVKNVGGELEVWAQPGMDIEVALLVVKTSNGDIAERAVVYPLDTDQAMEISLGRNISGTFTAAAEVSPLNGKPHTLLTSSVTSIRTGYAIAVEVTSKTPGTVDIWADNTYLGLTSRDTEGYLSPRGTSTICEIGGTAKRIMTVGAYTTRPEFTSLGNTTATPTGETLGEICTFSSNGPTADGRIKPQVAAPGSIIRAAVSINDNSGTIIYAAHHNDGTRDNYYGYMQGTSMSSPLVAGIVATWLEAFPEMTPEDLVDIIAATSRTDERPRPTADCDWGYGKIDALAGLKESIRLHDEMGVGSITAAPARTIARPVRAADGALHLLLTADANNLTINAYSAAGALIRTRRLDAVSAGQTIPLDLPAGINIIRLATPTATQTIKHAR